MFRSVTPETFLDALTDALQQGDGRITTRVTISDDARALTFNDPDGNDIATLEVASTGATTLYLP